MYNSSPRQLIKIGVAFLGIVTISYMIFLITQALNVHDFQPGQFSARTRALEDDFEDMQYLSLQNSDDLRNSPVHYLQLVNQMILKHYEMHKNLERRARVDGGVATNGNTTTFRIVFLPSNTAYNVTVKNDTDKVKSQLFTLEMKEAK